MKRLMKRVNQDPAVSLGVKMAVQGHDDLQRYLVRQGLSPQVGGMDTFTAYAMNTKYTYWLEDVDSPEIDVDAAARSWTYDSEQVAVLVRAEAEANPEARMPTFYPGSTPWEAMRSAAEDLTRMADELEEAAAAKAAKEAEAAEREQWGAVREALDEIAAECSGPSFDAALACFRITYPNAPEWLWEDIG